MEVGPQYNFLSIKLSVANIMQLKRIDFNSSNIISSGTSSSIYKLVSVMKIYDLKNNDKIKTYGLGQSVLAGNMYIEKGLLKKPPYLFQICGSINDQRIFRTFFPNTTKSKFPGWVKNDNTGDTYGNPLIRDFKINIINESAKKINGFDEIRASFPKNNFSARVIFTINDSTFNLEFPINHLNIQSKAKNWQVETGPILCPVIHNDDGLFEYLPSFMHFNVLDRLDIFYDYPFGIRVRENIVEDYPCQIELFYS